MNSQKQVAFAVIGDEILSGRTQDINVRVLALRLNEIGARLSEVRMIPDDAKTIISTVKELSQNYDYVFTSGGIGPTHDDITADCIAAAFEVGIDVREDAKKMLIKNYKNGAADLNDARLRMARIPDGATLILNPISNAPGFKLKNVFTLAGVPRIFEKMLDDALTHIETGQKIMSQSITINLPESKIAGPLGQIAQDYRNLSIGSYPQEENGRYFADIVIKGFDEIEIDQAISAVRAVFEAKSE